MLRCESSDGRVCFDGWAGAQCSGNETLAQQRIDRFRAMAQAAGLGNPIIGE